MNRAQRRLLKKAKGDPHRARQLLTQRGRSGTHAHHVTNLHDAMVERLNPDRAPDPHDDPT